MGGKLSRSFFDRQIEDFGNGGDAKARGSLEEVLAATPLAATRPLAATFLNVAAKTLVAAKINAQDYTQEYLDAHNAARAQVGVNNMSWNASVAAYAQNYANQRIGDCSLIHSGGPYGENLAGQSGGVLTGTEAVNLWVAENNFVTNFVQILRFWPRFIAPEFSNFGDLVQFTSQWGSCVKRRRCLTSICYVTAWSIWKTRCDWIFRKRRISPTRVADNVKTLVFTWIKHRSSMCNLQWNEWSANPFLCISATKTIEQSWMKRFQRCTKFYIINAQDYTQEYLDAHNAARAQVGVNNMSWNASVAAYAQNYANQRIGDCSLIHSGGPYGENLAGQSGGVLTGTEAVNLWVAENVYYDYETNSCVGGNECRHYTQVVWRNSNQIGCARVQCPNNDGWFIICSYYPRGNIIGQSPY
ncbi:hypothetical protein LXL04_015243 [Taraxacum kok-saghyz]